MSIAKDTITQKITMNYLSHLNVSIKETLKELEEKEVEVENAKKDFIDKRIKRRSLEVLKENQILEMKKEEERLEQISNDEFALYSYIRKTSNLQQKGEVMININLSNMIGANSSVQSESISTDTSSTCLDKSVIVVTPLV